MKFTVLVLILLLGSTVRLEKYVIYRLSVFSRVFMSTGILSVHGRRKRGHEHKLWKAHGVLEVGMHHRMRRRHDVRAGRRERDGREAVDPVLWNEGNSVGNSVAVTVIRSG